MKYYVYHSSYGGTYITIGESSEHDGFCGKFKTFKEAKKEATELACTTVENFKSDLEESKNNLKNVRRLTLKEIQND